MITCNRWRYFMFREMRRQDRAVSAERAYQILKEAEYGVFTIYGDDSYPYGVPVNHVVVDGDVYFHAATEGKKYDSIELNPKCGFTAVSYYKIVPEKSTTKYASTICMGKASFCEGEEKFNALVEIMKRYSTDIFELDVESIRKSLSRTSIIKITVEHITGKENK